MACDAAALASVAAFTPVSFRLLLESMNCDNETNRFAERAIHESGTQLRFEGSVESSSLEEHCKGRSKFISSEPSLL